jgi:sugar phosphate isomerase/epimerase
VRLSISNIAWDVPEDQAVGELLRGRGLDAIDIAPGKYFPAPAMAKDPEIVKVRTHWNDRGIDIVGMQALLFGTTGMNVFGSGESQRAMLLHLDAVCRIAAGVGATRLVFGSPRNRDSTGLEASEANDRARGFFHRLGDLAGSWGVTICLEPNPACYGANFMVTSLETAAMVKQIAHPAIRMQLDTGAMIINGEQAWDCLREHAGLIGHIHLSEPGMVPIGDRAGTDHPGLATAIQHHLPGHTVTVEMLATPDEPHLQSIDRALGLAIQYYRPVGGP